SQDKPKVLSLSLEDAIARTLQHNLGVAIQVLNPQLSEASLALAKEKFLPTFTLGANHQYTNSPSYSFLESSGSVVNKTDNYTFRGSESLPFGGTLSISATAYKTDSNTLYQSVNPRYGTTLSFNLTQPLLRNFGYNISRYSILVARNNLTASDLQLQQSIADTIYSVEQAYWSLVYTIENLRVRQQSVQLAKDLLEKNQRSVEIGTLAPMEILSAQAEVATREADLIQAETQVKNAEDQLKVLLNLPEDEARAIESIKALDTPPSEERRVDLDEALGTALQLRPDLAATKIGVDVQALTVRYQRNQMLPDLNLSASFSGPGLSGTQLIYQDNNPLTGIIVRTIPGGISGALKDSFSFKYPNWSLGVTLNVPIANLVSQANYLQAKVGLRQQMLSFENEKQQLYLEIKNAVRAVGSNFKRINAYRVARELAEQKLAAEEEKLGVGQSTNYTVLTYQRDLADARVSELNAIVAYSVSLASLDHSMGTNLKNRNVQLSDFLKD
ncbi:MAG TPA: TolC family protein, partial [Burkholderiales bacterium]|nr:TolC family protein [Burkholderiales bacterium]